MFIVWEILRPLRSALERWRPCPGSEADADAEEYSETNTCVRLAKLHGWIVSVYRMRVPLCACLSLSVHLPPSRFVYLSVRLSLFLAPFLGLPISLSICLSVSLLACLAASLSPCLSCAADGSCYLNDVKAYLMEMATDQPRNRL